MALPLTPLPLVLALRPYTPLVKPEVAFETPTTPVPPLVAFATPRTPVPLGVLV
jgi:hypothetical protein